MGSPKIARRFESPAHIVTDARAELAAQFIPAGARVLEIGSASLKPYLPFGCTHRAVRLDAFSSAALKADVVALFDAPFGQQLGATLFAELRRLGLSAIVTCPSDCGGEAVRGTDDFTFYDAVRAIDAAGFRIEASAVLGGDMVMRLTPARKFAPLAPCSVAVLGGGLTFAERLGAQMLNALLPGEADVHHLNLGDLSSARDSYDLVILGSGQGLFNSLFAPQVLDLVKCGRASIGIFGTQQRDLVPRKAFDKLLDRLDGWYARNEDDVLLYGRGRNNAVHLGDWLIGQFPLGQARDNELLRVGEESLQDLPLDRAIAAIQRHRTVFAHSPAALLCALTTADSVAYADENGDGECRSLLMDIFGRAWPQGEYVQVEREAVMRYRAKVHRNVASLRGQIAALLRGKAA